MNRPGRPEEEPTLLEISEAIADNQSQIDELKSLVEKLEGQLVTMRELLAPSEAALRARNEYLGRHMDKTLSEAVRRISDSAQALNEQRSRVLSLAEQIPARMNEIERKVLKQLGAWSTMALVMIGAASVLSVAAARWTAAASSPRPAVLSPDDPANILFDQMTPAKPAAAAKQNAPAKRTSRPRPSADASPNPAPTERW